MTSPRQRLLRFRNKTRVHLSLSLSLSLSLPIYIFFFVFRRGSGIHATRVPRARVRPSVAPAKRGSKCKSWRARFKRIPLLIRLARIRLSESALLCTCRTGRSRRVEDSLDNVSPWRTEGRLRAHTHTHTEESLPFFHGK